MNMIKAMRMLVMTTLTIVSQVPAAEVQVSPDGPYKTLAAARDAVRELRAAGEQGNIDVVIADGRYYLPETLIFGPGRLSTCWRGHPIPRSRGRAPVISRWSVNFRLAQTYHSARWTSCSSCRQGVGCRCAMGDGQRSVPCHVRW